MIKNLIRTLPLFALASSCLWASGEQTLFEDNFDRPNVGPTSTPALIGNGWNFASGQWSISNETLVSNRSSGGGTLITHASVGTGSLTYSLDIYTSSGFTGGWVGLVFNAKDTSNYDIIQFRPTDNYYQVFRVIDGTNTNLLSRRADLPKWEADSWYTIQLMTDYKGIEGDLKFLITARGSSTVLNTVTEHSLGTLPEGWSNNYFGLSPATNGGSIAFDNVSVTGVIPEPSSAALMGIGVICALALRMRARR